MLEHHLKRRHRLDAYANHKLDASFYVVYSLDNLIIQRPSQERVSQEQSQQLRYHPFPQIKAFLG